MFIQKPAGLDLAEQLIDPESSNTASTTFHFKNLSIFILTSWYKLDYFIIKNY